MKIAYGRKFIQIQMFRSEKVKFVHEFLDKDYRTPILDVADLKQRMIAAWSGLQLHVIDEAINQ